MNIHEGVFEQFYLESDDMKQKLAPSLIIEEGIEIAEDQFLTQLYEVYLIVENWNNSFREDFDFTIETLEISSDHEDAPFTKIVYVSLDEPLKSLEELEGKVIEENK